MTQPLTDQEFWHYRRETNPRRYPGLVTVEVLDAVPDGQRLRAMVARAMTAHPRLRQRVLRPAVPTTGPHWVVDRDFDLDYHLRQVRLPAPGGERELLDLAELTLQSTFDPSRPLWTLTLVEGVFGDQAAVLLHHSHALDFGSGPCWWHDVPGEADVASEPGAVEADSCEVGSDLDEPVDLSDQGQIEPAGPGSPVVTPASLAGQALAAWPATAVNNTRAFIGGAIGAVQRFSQDPSAAVAEAQEYADSIRRVAGPGALRVSPALHHRSLRSRTVAVEFDVAAFDEAAMRAQATVADAALAALTAALRAYVHAIRRPLETLTLAVPAESGGSMLIDASLAELDPGERMQQIRQARDHTASEPAADLVNTLVRRSAWLPDAVFEAVCQARPVPDVAVHAVPAADVAPGGETHIAGARVERAYTLGPRDGSAVVASFSTRGERGTLTTRCDIASVTHPTIWEQALNLGIHQVTAFGRGQDPLPSVVPAAIAKPRPRRARRTPQ